MIFIFRYLLCFLVLSFTLCLLHVNSFGVHNLWSSLHEQNEQGGKYCLASHLLLLLHHLWYCCHKLELASKPWCNGSFLRSVIQDFFFMDSCILIQKDCYEGTPKAFNLFIPSELLGVRLLILCTVLVNGTVRREMKHSNNTNTCYL